MLLWSFNMYPGTDNETFNWHWTLTTVKHWADKIAEFFDHGASDLVHEVTPVVVNDWFENEASTSEVFTGAVENSTNRWFQEDAPTSPVFTGAVQNSIDYWFEEEAPTDPTFIRLMTDTTNQYLDDHGAGYASNMNDFVKNYNFTSFAFSYTSGKYVLPNGNTGTNVAYNCYEKIPVVKDNTYRFTGKGARSVVLYDENNTILSGVENVYSYTPAVSGYATITEFSSDPLEMFLDNIKHGLKNWTLRDVKGGTTSGATSTTIDFDTNAGDIVHFKLYGYTGQHFTNCLLYAVNNGASTIVASLYSTTGEYVFTAPAAASYRIYINQNQSETAYLDYSLTKLNNGTVFDNLDRLNIKTSLLPNIYGKKIACLGDSFTYGVETYVKKLNDRYLSHAINYGVASSRIVLDTVSGGNTIESFLNRYDDMDNDADIITVFGGINDSYDIGAGDLTLGTIDSPLNISTFYGGLKLLVTNLMRKYPDKQIIGIIPPDCQTGQYYIENLPDVQEAEREVYAFYGIPIIDIRKDCYKMSTLPEMVAIYRESTSNIHPSNAGQNALCDTIAAGIRKITI